MPAEKVRLRIGNLAKAVLVSGQAYQDPKDALNEFVSNAADEYAEAHRRGERVRIILRPKGRYPVIAVDDVGRGMSPERLREVARNLFESSISGPAEPHALNMLFLCRATTRRDLPRPDCSST
jgi:C4-dicarboxylate-specific signal transduction histidine kinase